MVSNARLDLPEPDNPVTTIKLSRGISSEMFLRLCTRAPCTAIVVRAAALRCFPFDSAVRRARACDEVRPAVFPCRFIAALAAIRSFSRIEECQLLHLDVALFRQVDGG